MKIHVVFVNYLTKYQLLPIFVEQNPLLFVEIFQTTLVPWSAELSQKSSEFQSIGKATQGSM